MSYKKQIYLIIFFSLLIAGTTIIECKDSTDRCWNIIQYVGPDLEEGIVLSLVFFPAPIFLLSIIFLFLREEVFRSWFKFARIYIPLALIFIFLSAWSPGGGSWGVSNNFDGEAATWFFSGLFLLISLILIFYKSRKLKKTSG